MCCSVMPEKRVRRSIPLAVSYACTLLLRSLDVASEVLKARKADHRGHQRGKQAPGREQIAQCRGKALPVPITHGKLSHQQVGVEQKDDECDLKERGLDDRFCLCRPPIASHAAIIQAHLCCY